MVGRFRSQMKSLAADILILTLFVAPLIVGILSQSIRWAALISSSWALCASIIIVIWYRSFYPFEDTVSVAMRVAILSDLPSELFVEWLLRASVRAIIAGAYGGAVFWIKQRIRGRSITLKVEEKKAMQLLILSAAVIFALQQFREWRAWEQFQSVRRTIDSLPKITPSPYPTGPIGPPK
jgi:hypothetical protein